MSADVPKTGKPALPDELNYLISAFLSSEKPHEAYLILSYFCQGVRKDKQPDIATQNLSDIFSPLILSHLEETNEHDILIAVTFLTALFQVDWQSAAIILQKDTVLEMIMDSVDLKPSEELSLQVAHLLSQACGHKPCRAIIHSETTQWLEFMSSASRPDALRAAATVALVKLLKGSASDSTDLAASADAEPAPLVDKTEDELASMMKNMIVSGKGHSSVADAVEGLAYLTVNPVVKELVTHDSSFLKALLGLIPLRKTLTSSTTTELRTSLVYGVILIISNLSAYLPQLNEEQVQMQKLRRMAKTTGSVAGEDQSVLNSDKKVQARIRKLVANGVLGVFPPALAMSADSVGIRMEIGKTMLNIIVDKDVRGEVLSSGGSRVLSKIVKASIQTSSGKSTLDPSYLEPIQALSKLAITASPVQVFGPEDGAIFDVIRPFSLALQHSSTLLLQKFEIMMALTNLSSHSAEVASRIADADGLFNRVELFLFDDHVLIRRAAMELICNLIAGSDKAFQRYGGVEKEDSGAKSKVQVLLALSDVDDLPTRLAASGALATVTSESGACFALLSLQMERHNVLSIIAQLIDPSVVGVEEPTERDGLVHRGVMCARNFLLGIGDTKHRSDLVKDATSCGLLKALAEVVKNNQAPPVVQSAAETMKWLLTPS